MVTCCVWTMFAFVLATLGQNNEIKEKIKSKQNWVSKCQGSYVHLHAKHAKVCHAYNKTHGIQQWTNLKCVGKMQALTTNSILKQFLV